MIAENDIKNTGIHAHMQAHTQTMGINPCPAE